MANTNFDNYIDSLEEGDKIEFEWDEMTFMKFIDKIMICENWEWLNTTEFHDDLEFWYNNLFHKYLYDKKIDDLQNDWILNSKQEKDV